MKCFYYFYIHSFLTLQNWVTLNKYNEWLEEKGVGVRTVVYSSTMPESGYKMVSLSQKNIIEYYYKTVTKINYLI